MTSVPDILGGKDQYFRVRIFSDDERRVQQTWRELDDRLLFRSHRLSIFLFSLSLPDSMSCVSRFHDLVFETKRRIRETRNEVHATHEEDDVCA